ncbi:MAG: Gldg family protein, partial [Eubacteriales bacterium]
MSKNTNTTNARSTKMGAYSAFLTLVVIAFVVVVNLMVGELPTTMTKFDTSSLQLYTLSDTTVSMVKGLNEDVTMYYIVQNGTEDANIEEILNRYASYSSRVKIRVIDPTSNPSFSSKYTDDTLSNNSVIVESAKRSSVVMYEE